jgi:hypothetical protein
MPPRYAYWTILVDETPTAFRAGSQEDLMPTFKRLKAKHPSATMMWFQNGKLWPSRIDAQEAMHARGEMGRRGDERQLAHRRPGEGGAGFRDRGDKPFRPRRDKPPFSTGDKPAFTPRREVTEKLDWKRKGDFVPAPKRERTPDSEGETSRAEKPEWKPKGEFSPAPRRSEKPDWKPKGAFTPEPRRSEKPDWKPKSASFDRERKSDWKPKGAFPTGQRANRPTGQQGASRQSEKPEWKPKGTFVPAPKRPRDAERRPAWGSNASSEARKASYSERSDDNPRGAYARPTKRDWTPKSGWTSKRPAAADRPARSERPDWKPKASAQDSESSPSEKRKWVPKEEYKKSRGIEAKKDKNWRPGGDHKDPRQKYKDAKKAKWTKFKKAIRTRAEGKKNKDS